MSEEFERRGFDGPWLPTEEIAQLRLERFRGLVVATSDKGIDRDVATVLRSSDDLAGGYRACWPDGLTAYRNGNVKSYDVGVLQVVVARDLLTHPAAKPLLDKACVRHEMQATSRDPTALFDIYHVDIPIASPGGPELIGQREALQLWAQLRRWGLTHVDEIEVVFRRMEKLRRHYREQARPALRRPLGPAVPKSRYDFILDGPQDPEWAGGLPSFWVPDGAEVAREVVDKLREVLPTLTSRRTKGATKRLGQFYDDLKCLRLYLQNTPHATEQIPFPGE